MSHSRQTLADFLAVQFQNPSLKEQCQTSSLKALALCQKHQDTGQLSRLFDGFPLSCLLPKNEMEKLSDSLTQIRAGITGIKTDKGVMLANPKNDGFQIERWEKKLIDLAYAYLVDTRGNIRQEVVNKLGWGAYRSELKTDIVLSAFVGAINHTIILDPDKINSDLGPDLTALAICHHLNQHKLDWIISKLTQEHPSFAVTRLVREHPVSTVIVSTAALGIFGLAASLAVVALSQDAQPSGDKHPAFNPYR